MIKTSYEMLYFVIYGHSVSDSASFRAFKTSLMSINYNEMQSCPYSFLSVVAKKLGCRL